MIIFTWCPCSRVLSHCLLLGDIFRGVLIQLNCPKTMALFSRGVLAIGSREPSHCLLLGGFISWSAPIQLKNRPKNYGLIFTRVLAVGSQVTVQLSFLLGVLLFS